MNYIEQELKTILDWIKVWCPDLDIDEIEEICREYLAEIPAKIKDVTKIKRLRRYLTNDFDIDLEKKEESKTSNAKYSLDNIPKYLFEGKNKIKFDLVNIVDLTANIGLTHLFEWLNFRVWPTDKIALIWKNGSGKTTLLKLIIWKEPEQIEMLWDIKVPKNIKIWYLSQDLFWEDENHTLEQEMKLVFSEITKKVEELEKLKLENKETKKIAQLTQELLDIDWFKKYDLQLNILKYFWFSQEQMKQKVSSLSGWEQTKVQIAKFLIQQVDLLILDEPTNYLDIEWIIFLERFCQNWKKAIILISHDKRFIDNASEKICEIYHHKIFSYKWKYNNYMKQKQALYDKQMKDYQDQQKFLEKEWAYINRFRANSAKATSVQSRLKALKKIELLKQPENEQQARFIQIKTLKRLPKTIMKLEKMIVGYEKPLIELPEEIEVLKTDKIWIVGANGVWKTTLLKTILGDIKPLSWKTDINKKIKIGSFAQVLDNLNMENEVIKELANTANEEQEVRKILWWLLIRWDKVNQKISSLSGGERAKVWLTKMLLDKPDIIIMDEPTNHLDLHSKEVIKTMLKWFDWMIMIVSHDRDLLENISNKIWLVKDKKLEVFDDVEEGINSIVK